MSRRKRRRFEEEHGEEDELEVEVEEEDEEGRLQHERIKARNKKTVSGLYALDGDRRKEGV